MRLGITLLVMVALGGSALLAAAPGVPADAKGIGDLEPESAFLPPPGAGNAHQSFHGTLVLREAAMITVPSKLRTLIPLQQDPRVFPAARLSFVSDGGELVPTSEELQRVGTLGLGRSYWDIIVQPGETWSQADDAGWSHASFPFALVNGFENETHNGMARFRYRGNEVSDVHVQISAGTAPFAIQTAFTAKAEVHARFEPLPGPLPATIALHRRAKADQVPFASWSELEQKLGRAAPDIDAGLDPSGIVVDGIGYQGTFYVHRCAGAAGPLAWCERRRFGVWSATKSMITATALLRLAQAFGPGVLNSRIAAYVPEAAASPRWRNVRFVDAINMATGVGNGKPDAPADAIQDGVIDETYFTWYFARSAHDKLVALVRDGRAYPWGAGRVARYRDQDMFMLGVAIDRYLKKHRSKAASIWSMLTSEVFEPIGIHIAPVNTTLEQDGAEGIPLMAFGYYPTISDMVKIARLYQQRGAWQGRQLLYRPIVDQIMDPMAPHGLPAGPTGDGAELDYFHAFWRHPFLIREGCRRYVPKMRGYGGVTIMLLPGGVTTVRVARLADSPEIDEPLLTAAGLGKLGCETP